jgi:hypothetical protein
LLRFGNCDTKIRVYLKDEFIRAMVGWLVGRVLISKYDRHTERDTVRCKLLLNNNRFGSFRINILGCLIRKIMQYRSELTKLKYFK